MNAGKLAARRDIYLKKIKKKTLHYPTNLSMYTCNAIINDGRKK